MNLQNFGFKESVIEDNHYLLGDGSIAPQILQPDGQWDAFLPPDEFQSRGDLETYNCTSEGTIHALATLGNRKFNTPAFAPFQKNLSPRYLGIMANTSVNGNDPHYVCEVLRTRAGVVPDIFLPFSPDIQNIVEYYSPKPITYQLFATGQHWLKKYKISHSWCYQSGDSLAVKQQKMIEALQYSPLGVSVYAWSLHSDGKYYSDTPGQNHWVTLYGYVQGQYWKIFDSYDNTHKKLDWNFTFGQNKMFTLDYNIGGENLGIAPERVYLPYAGYLLGEYVKNILR